MDISAAISSAVKTLRHAGIDESRREAASLLAFILGKEAVFLIAHPEYQLTKAEATAFESVIGRRAAREPFHYIVGRKEFYGLDFEVVPGVLIPRPETEILVEAAIGIISEIETPIFFEIGVGSGCISLAVLKNVKGSRAVGVDVSELALRTAAANAERHGVAGRLMLRKADIFEGLDGKFDLIVSNPPYIPDDDLRSLQPEVGQFEPPPALFGGPDGLAIVRRIVRDSPDFLEPRGFLLIEIGFGQNGTVTEMFDTSVWESVEFLSDLQGIPRIVKARLRN